MNHGRPNDIGHLWAQKTLLFLKNAKSKNMKVQIQYIKMPTNDSLGEMVTQNLNKLAHKFPFVLRADVIFKEENDPSERGMICEIRLSAPGPRLFAKSDESSFEKAAMETVSDLERQLKKRKGVLKKHH